METSKKSYENAILLSFFLGMYGIDRFYLGKVGTGVAKLLTLGGLGVWYCVDLLLIAFGRMRDRDGLLLKDAKQPHTLVKALVVLTVASNAFLLFAIVISGLIWWLGGSAPTNF